MTSFTMALKDAIEATGGSVSIVDGIAVMTGGNIGLNDYPIYDETHRAMLNGKIIDHFWNREIGMETIEMFQLATRRKMNEIMPSYNQLYVSTTIEFDPLSTIDIHSVSSSQTTAESSATGATDSESTSESGSRAVVSETPQTMLSPNADYATSGNDVLGTGKVNTEGSENSEQDSFTDSNSDSRVSGFQGVASDLLMAYRASIINIDLMIINELEELFMSVWDSSDSFTKGYYF